MLINEEKVSGNDRGVLHELLVGYHLNGGKHLEKHPDVSGLSPEQAHDKLKSSIPEKKYEEFDQMAKAASKDIRKNIEKHGRIKNVSWTSKPGDVQRATGIQATQEEDPSDLVIHTEHPKTKKPTYHGVSLKITNKKRDVAISNPGMEATFGANHILNKHRVDLLDSFPSLKRIGGKDKRKEWFDSRSEKTQKIILRKNMNTLDGITAHLHGELGKMSTSDIADHLRHKILKTSPTPLQKMGHNHLRHITSGTAEKYSFTSVSPDHPQPHEKILDDHQHITTEKRGNSVLFRYKNVPFARHRIKFENQRDPLSPIKGSGEIIKSKLMTEEVVNSIGSGNFAGLEPDIPVVRTNSVLRRKKFAGKTVFVVDEDTFHKSYLGKKKYEHYEKYLGSSDIGEEIRDYGRKNWDESIILQNEKTGAMVYLKYGKK